VELTAHHTVEEHGKRELKVTTGRDILDASDEASIGPAPCDIVGLHRFACKRKPE
jgi:hypothetical protein